MAKKRSDAAPPTLVMRYRGREVALPPTPYEATLAAASWTPPKPRDAVHLGDIDPATPKTACGRSVRARNGTQLRSTRSVSQVTCRRCLERTPQHWYYRYEP